MPPSPTVTTTQSFNGTTRQTGVNSCTSDSHAFTAQDGPVAVLLQETSDPAGALAVQVCAGGVDNNNCSVNVTRIAVGNTVGGTRKGTSNQELKLLPHSCVFGGPFDTTVPITYRVQVTYQR